MLNTSNITMNCNLLSQSINNRKIHGVSRINNKHMLTSYHTH